MNVYMFDDNVNKQRHFLSVLDSAKQQAQSLGINTELKPGFGGDAAKASEESVKAEQIFGALLDSNGVYLIDLKMTTDEPQDLPFKKLLIGHDAAWSKAALAEFDILGTSNDEDVREVCEKFPVALLLLCCCKADSRPALLASTDTDSPYVTTVQSLNLVGHGPNRPFPYQKATPSAEGISAWGQSLLGMLDELDRVSKETSSWFDSDYHPGWRDSDGLPHGLDGLPLDQHKRIVRKVLPWAPESWWETPADVSALHDCLKFSIGRHASWVTSAEENPLCLGGAYLLLLIAVAQSFPKEFMRFVLPSFRPFVRAGKPIPFLPDQSHRAAQLAVRALYDFYCLIRAKKSSGCEALLGIEAIRKPEEELRFCIRLSWDEKQVRDFGAEFSRRVTEGLRSESIGLPTAKASAALIRFLLSSCSRKDGAGPLGTIQINEKRECWVGQGGIAC